MRKYGEDTDDRYTSGTSASGRVPGLKWMDSVRLTRLSRLGVVIVVYFLGLLTSLLLSYQLRFDFNLPPGEWQECLRSTLWILPLKLMVLLGIGQFAGLLSYFSVPDLRRLVLALAASSIIMALVWHGSQGHMAPPRSIIVLDLLLSVMMLAAIRLFFRLVREQYFTIGFWNVDAARVGIVGAGSAGSVLARELSLKRDLGLRPIVFFDDNPQKWGTRVHDIPIIGAPECLAQHRKQLQLDKIIIAMPSASGRRMREVVRLLQSAHIPFETVPSIDQLAAGTVKVSQLRPVAIEDLLGREPVKLETENIRSILKGRVVMVTGAGGSIGSELCRQIAAFGPERLLLVEQSEVQIFAIEQELIGLGYSPLILPIVADILDYPRMNAVFERYQPEVVFHAAAHKHVPMMERHPCEAIKNNTLGTAQLAELCLEHHVQRFVLISTDKAINPTSVMGASKRLAEIFVQACSARHPGPTKFMAVRFGNVLGSSGSVVPIFQKQIAAGGPITVTHPDVERFFMTIPEAVGLVLQSAAQGRGGEIFVLDMGRPIKIVDLARHMIELSGLQPDVDIEIQFTGLRPGEKLTEELFHASEDCVPTTHPKIMRFISRAQPLAHVQEQLRILTQQVHNSDSTQLKRFLQAAVPEYTPFLDPRPIDFRQPAPETLLAERATPELADAPIAK